MNASGLPITQLGSTIKAHMTTAEKYIGKCEEHYKAAGLHLIEAKQRIATGEYEGKFGMFIMKECGGLSSSRAYELIAVANGTKTVEQVRAGTAERMRKQRQRRASPSRDGEQQPPRAVRDVPESPPDRSFKVLLIKEITLACQGLSIEQLNTILSLARSM